MHKNEVKIDTMIVKKLLSQQFPSLASLPIKQVQHFGTDNAIFRLGDDKCIRLPRIGAFDTVARQIDIEHKWLPKFAPHLPLKIPTPIKQGEPSEYYPFSWSIYNWIAGKNAYDENFTDLERTAKGLANFINSLQAMDTDGAPSTRRGLPLESQDKAVRKAILELKGMFDANAVTTIWEECLNASNWDKPQVWLHGDLLPSNLLIQNGELSAIIDFGLSGIGDPACDLIPAWCVFNANSRNIFRKALKVDNDTWLRGKGWALSIALIIIPYYLNTNPVLVDIAKRIIDEMQFI